MEQNPSKNASIAVFDSGVGGLSVMRELIRLMPNENFIYFGDTARVPYGNKNPKTILNYSIENISFLLDQNIKLLVIACHTVCAHALENLQQLFPIHIVGVILPGFESLIKATQNFSVAILGTVNTIASGVYQKLIMEHHPHAKIHPIACPLFVPLIEEGFSDHLMVQLAAKEYLNALHGKGIDSALLACTHYPLIFETIKKTLPSSVTLVDPSLGCATETLNYLNEKKLNRTQVNLVKHKFYVTDAPDKFKRTAEKFLGLIIPYVELKPV